MTHYIYLADDVVGVPILLGEALNDLLRTTQLHPSGRFPAPVGEELFGMWLWTLAALKNGGAEAFVQGRLSRRWARLPRAYWASLDPFSDPPEVLDDSDDPELRGQPIVLQKDGLALVQEILWDALNTAGSTPLSQAAISVAANKRANPVSEEELAEWFRAVRVPSLEGAKPPTWEDCWDAAKDYFNDKWVTRDRLQFIRSRSVPDAWNKPGPRKAPAAQQG